ncbi:hypothetical protein CYFUS_004464 [Cystobacter fuscus]|uniref:Uncharacterized protein n=1 Tax=Cystobacter fuscus TaxID=43 RepID=A0A250J514_9BACT|nr:hypothetical protein [Cystobacter fuscus]ATB39025.1 hypothetical protein CYFUS_004464 [Cystobacter fuscus]
MGFLSDILADAFRRPESRHTGNALMRDEGAPGWVEDGSPLSSDVSEPPFATAGDVARVVETLPAADGARLEPVVTDTAPVGAGFPSAPTRVLEGQAERARVPAAASVETPTHAPGGAEHRVAGVHVPRPPPTVVSSGSRAMPEVIAQEAPIGAPIGLAGEREVGTSPAPAPVPSRREALEPLPAPRETRGPVHPRILGDAVAELTVSSGGGEAPREARGAPSSRAAQDVSSRQARGPSMSSWAGAGQDSGDVGSKVSTPDAPRAVAPTSSEGVRTERGATSKRAQVPGPPALPERAPVLPPRSEPPAPRVHIGEVHVTITAPALAPRPAAPAASPSLLSRHYLRST